MHLSTSLCQDLIKGIGVLLHSIGHCSNPRLGVSCTSMSLLSFVSGKKHFYGFCDVGKKGVIKMYPVFGRRDDLEQSESEGQFPRGSKTRMHQLNHL